MSGTERDIPYANGGFYREWSFMVSPDDAMQLDLDEGIDISLSSQSRDLMADIVDCFCQFLPQVEDEGKVSSLVRDEMADLLKDIYSNACKKGIVRGFDDGFFAALEMLGNPMEEYEDEILDTMKKNTERYFFNGEDAESGWTECIFVISKIGTEDILEMSAKWRVNWKKAATLMEVFRRIVCRHRHVSKNDVVYEPAQMMKQLLEVSNAYKMNEFLLLDALFDTLSLFERANIISTEYSKAIQDKITFDHLRTYRAGVAFEDIFA